MLLKEKDIRIPILGEPNDLTVQNKNLFFIYIQIAYK